MRKITISIQLEEPLLKKIDEQAEQNYTTRSNQIRTMLNDYYKYNLDQEEEIIEINYVKRKDTKERDR